MAKDYAGRIGNSGAQFVQAPGQLSRKKSGGKIVRGEDLRDGRGRKDSRKN